MSPDISPTPPEPAPSGAAMDRRIVRSSTARLRRWAWPAAALIAVIAAGVAATILVPGAGSLSVARDRLTTAPAQLAAFDDFLPVRAAAAALHTDYVGAIEGGQVATVSVQDGALVKKGDVLATLSNPQLQLDVTSREAAIAGQLGGVSAQRLALQQSLATEDAAIADTAYALLKAQRDLGIRTRLHEAGFESDAGLKSFSDEVHYQSGRLALLRAARDRDRQVAGAQGSEIGETDARLHSNLAVVDASLQALTLRAPVAGRLTDFLLQPGQTLKQGDQIGQIDSEGAWRLDADVDEFYLGRVAAGQHATAEIAGTTAGLTVSRVKPQVTGGVFRAELLFDAPPPPGLRRGQSAETRITLGATQRALVLPNGPWLEGGGGSIAFVVDPDGRHARRRTIVSGRRNPDQVEITAGLHEGDRIVTSSTQGFDAYATLNID